MTIEEKIAVLEDMLELENGTLTVETKLSLIVISDEEFGKKLTGEQLREFKTIGDILTFWE